MSAAWMVVAVVIIIAIMALLLMTGYSVYKTQQAELQRKDEGSGLGEAAGGLIGSLIGAPFNIAGAALENVGKEIPDSKSRGVGKPLRCGKDETYDAGLCYKKCIPNYHRKVTLCYQDKPGGSVGKRLSKCSITECTKDHYGRGAGFPWKFGDKVGSLDGARKRCEKSKQAKAYKEANPKATKGCEKYGQIIYPKCKFGYKNVGCCICRAKCPPKRSTKTGKTLKDSKGNYIRWKDTGVNCQRPKYSIGVGKPIHSCYSYGNKDEKGTWDKDAGLCYPPCPKKYPVGVGPVCWAKKSEGEKEREKAIADAKAALEAKDAAAKNAETFVGNESININGAGNSLINM